MHYFECDRGTKFSIIFYFMAKKVQSVSLNGMSFENFITYAVHACSELDWATTYLSESGVRMETAASFKRNTNGEIITITEKDGVVTILSESIGTVITDFGNNKKNINTLLEKIEEVKKELPPDQHAIIKNRLSEMMKRGDEDELNPTSKAAKEVDKFWSIFIPKKDFFITPIIIGINVVLFLLMVITSMKAETIMQPDNETLLTWGANFKPYTLDGQWWRLFTSIFEHIGIFHLVMNMYALLYAGIFLEPLLGRIRFTAAYIVTGLFASLASLWWHDSSIGAGASGAIFGMYGVFLALLLTNLIEKTVRQQLLKSIGIFIALNIVIGISSGFVDNAAHLGGLISGFFIGFVLYFSLLQPFNKMREAIVCLLLFIAIGTASFVIIPKINNPVGSYIKIMDDFGKAEDRAIAVYALPDSTSATVLIKEYTEVSIPSWESCEKSLAKIEVKALPEPLQKRVGLLKEYTEARKKEALLRKRALEESSSNYEAEINELEAKANGILKQLSSE